MPRKHHQFLTLSMLTEFVKSTDIRESFTFKVITLVLQLYFELVLGVSSQKAVGEQEMVGFEPTTTDIIR